MPVSVTSIGSLAPYSGPTHERASPQVQSHEPSGLALPLQPFLDRAENRSWSERRPALAILVEHSVPPSYVSRPTRLDSDVLLDIPSVSLRLRIITHVVDGHVSNPRTTLYAQNPSFKRTCALRSRGARTHVLLIQGGRIHSHSKWANNPPSILGSTSGPHFLLFLMNGYCYDFQCTRPSMTLRECWRSPDANLLLALIRSPVFFFMSPKLRRAVLFQYNLRTVHSLLHSGNTRA